MIFTLNLLLQNHLAKFERSKFPTIAKHKYFNKKINHVYNFNCFRISISLGNEVNYSRTWTSLSAKFSNTEGQREENISHHMLLQFDTLWTQSNATITVLNWQKTFATEKVRKGGPNTQQGIILSCLPTGKRKKQQQKQCSTKENHLNYTFHFLLSNDFHIHKSILHLCMEFKDSFLILHGVTQNTPQKSTRQERRKATAGAEQSKGRANSLVNSQKGEPEWQRNQQKDSRGQVA